MAGDAVAVLLVDTVNSLSVNIQTMAGNAVAVLLPNRVNSLSMDDCFVAVLSLDFIHHKKYLLWMNTTDLKRKMHGLFLWLCRYWKGSTLEPVVSFCCYVAVPLLARVNCQIIRQMMLKLCHYWKGSTLEPMVTCCCGCAITGRVNSRTNG